MTDCPDSFREGDGFVSGAGLALPLDLDGLSAAGFLSFGFSGGRAGEFREGASTFGFTFPDLFFPASYPVSFLPDGLSCPDISLRDVPERSMEWSVDGLVRCTVSRSGFGSVTGAVRFLLTGGTLPFSRVERFALGLSTVFRDAWSFRPLLPLLIFRSTEGESCFLFTGGRFGTTGGGVWSLVRS